MEYTVQRLAKLAGISGRTLRYYDEIGLLAPRRINSSGYRLYGEKEVDALQQILFFRELGFPLEQIRDMVHSPAFNRLEALEKHLSSLAVRQAQISLLMENVKKTIRKEKGEVRMTDQEKFEGLKENLLRENEEQYGQEIREKYGSETVEKSNEAFKNMSKSEYDAMTELAAKINAMLNEAVAKNELPQSAMGQSIAKLHQQWIQKAWGSYSREAHIGLVNMYVEDERFTVYYDKEVKGCAAFLKEAVTALLQ